MKKILFSIFIGLFLFGAVFAVGPQGAGASSSGQEVSTQNTGEETQLAIATQAIAGNLEEFKQMAQERKRVLEEQAEGKQGAEAKAYKNQNQVRNAVHNLLAMGELVGGIGPQVSEIARQWNNRINESLKAEATAQKKGAFARLLFGGDKETGEELEQIANQNKEAVQQLKQLRQQCQADEEVCEAFEEQIQVMEKEQERLTNLAKAEKGKGLLGWLWK